MPATHYIARPSPWAAALAIALLPASLQAQQPTLRYAAQAARRAAPAVQQAGFERDDEGVQAAVGTGTKHPVRRAAREVPMQHAGPMPPRRPASRPRMAAWEDADAMSPEVIASPSPGQRIILHEGADDLHLPGGGPWHDDGDCASCGHAGYGRMYCGDPACGGADCCLPCFRLDTLELFAGAHGFTGPLNRGSGSFGFHEGINAGVPFICGFAIQGGYQATQNNFEGSFFTPDDRTQSFVTVGLFRRVDLGLGGGVVVDYLNDKWDYDVNLTQLRGELSWKMPCEHEWGFWFAAGLDRSTIDARQVQFPLPGGNEDTVVISDGSYTVQPLDIYAFFYRKTFACGGEGRAWGGFTDDSRGLLGGNIRLPVSNCLAFTTDFLYIIPAESSQTAFADEAWNVSFNFVWTPCFRNRCGPNYCRPLFDVANNGSFVVNAVAN